jgi:DNA end-binding protein Ku
LHTLYYSGELHQANRADAAKTKFSAKELELAKTLISQMAAPFKPAAFHDIYRENVERLIEQKQKGQKITAVKQPRKAPVIDLMQALQRSLKSAGPAKSAAKRGSRPSRKTASRHTAA